MSEVRFYHLTTKMAEQALPELLLKALERGQRAVVRVSDSTEAEHLAEALWVFHPAHFLPHGTARDGNAALQPVWITDRDENPNAADILILSGAAAGADLLAPPDFTLRCALFDGRDAQALENARARWKACREAGHAVTYWQQGEAGKWEKKAG